MRKIRIITIAILLASAAGACSKCDIPDLLPKFCRTGPAAS
jgi:hypothetical protein